MFKSTAFCEINPKNVFEYQNVYTHTCMSVVVDVINGCKNGVTLGRTAILYRVQLGCSKELLINAGTVPPFPAQISLWRKTYERALQMNECTQNHFNYSSPAWHRV